MEIPSRSEFGFSPTYVRKWGVTNVYSIKSCSDHSEIWHTCSGAQNHLSSRQKSILSDKYFFSTRPGNDSENRGRREAFCFAENKETIHGTGLGMVFPSSARVDPGHRLGFVPIEPIGRVPEHVPGTPFLLSQGGNFKWYWRENQRIDLNEI